MREFVGLADDERIKGIARIQLVVTALKIQFRLFHAGDYRRGLHRFFFRANVLHLHARRPDFMEDGLDDVAIRARHHLPEHRAGDLDKKRVPLGAVQPGGLKPGRKGVDADSGLHPIKKFVPEIHSFALTPKLSCSRHRKRKKPLCYFHRCAKTVESRSHSRLSSASGVLPALERSSLPLSLRARPVWNCRPTNRRYESAR